MAERTENPEAKQPVEKECNHLEPGQIETENLSTKLTNIPVVTSSLKTVSKTCHTIKESNTYVGYGMTVAESSLDKAFQAGKAVLDSRTLAPITNTAIENIRFLDKEAGVMVDKFLKVNEKQSSEGQANGGVQDISRNTSLAVDNESLIYFLGRKLVQVTSFLVFLPYIAPKYALSTILGFFQSGSNVVGRKRKERGSLSEEVKLMEPSPVKRKYGDRLSTSSEEETLEEVLRDYKSEEDPDYVPDEHEMEESSDELEETSKESGNEQDRNESIHECLELSQGLQDCGVSLSPETKLRVEMLKLEAKEGQTNTSSPKKTSESSSTPDTKASKAKTTETIAQGKAENKTTDSKATKLEETSLKEPTIEGQDVEKTETSKDTKESKGGKIDPSSKTRRSSKSPLLQKLLSPGRRSSRKSQKNKTETEKELEETAAVSEGSTSKREDNTTKAHSEPLGDSSKIAKVEAKAHDTIKSKEKQDEAQKKAETVESSTKGAVKTDESQKPVNEPLSTVTGPLDVFKFGSKKSK